MALKEDKEQLLKVYNYFRDHFLWTTLTWLQFPFLSWDNMEKLTGMNTERILALTPKPAAFKTLLRGEQPSVSCEAGVLQASFLACPALTLSLCLSNPNWVCQ